MDSLISRDKSEAKKKGIYAAAAWGGTGAQPQKSPDVRQITQAGAHEVSGSQTQPHRLCSCHRP